MPISQKDALNELRKRFTTLAPKQQAAIQELERRGFFGDVEPVAPKPIETVLPSGVSEDDFARIQRTGLTPGTAVQHAGVSIATENNRRSEEGIPALSSKQQADRLRVFQQQAGTPGSEIVDQFQVAQEHQRNERGTTLGGRVRSVGLGFADTIAQTGASLVGVFAPENANKISEELRTIINPDGSLPGKAGSILGELAKTVAAGRLGPAGLAGFFGAQGVGGVRQEVQQLRKEGQEISGRQELETAAGVGGVEAVSGFVAGKIFGQLGKTLKTMSPFTKIGLQQGKTTAVKQIVKSSLAVLKGSTQEGAEEGLTQLVTNKIRQGIRPELALTEGVLEAIATGAIIAPFAGALSPGAAGSKTAPGAATSQQVEVSPDAQGIPGTEATTQVPPVPGADVSPESQNVDTSGQPVAVDTTGLGDLGKAGAAIGQNLRDAIFEAHTTGTGPLKNDPLVTATNQEATRLGRPLTRQEFDVFIETQAVPPVPGRETSPETGGDAQASDISIPAKVTQTLSDAPRTPEGGIQTSKAGVVEFREKLNLPELQGEPAQEFQTELNKAIEEKLPDQALQIAREVTLNPQALTIKKTAALGVRAIDLQTQNEALNDSLLKANEGTQSQLLSTELNRVEEELDVITNAISISRSEAGRALVAGKLTLDRNFNLPRVLKQARTAAGKPLTLTRRATVTKLVKKIQRLEKELKQARGRGVVGKGQTSSKFLERFGFGSTLVEKLQFEQNKTRAKLGRIVDSWRPRTVVQNIAEPLNFVRAFVTSYDVSAPFRQGGLLVAANPVRGAKALGPMFRALVSEKQTFLIDQEIRNRPNGKKPVTTFVDENGTTQTVEGLSKYEESELFLSSVEQDAKLNEQEEVFMGRLTRFFPGVRASNRAFVTFLNKLRADSFDAMEADISRGGQATLPEAKVIANFVNVASGRGKFNEKLDKAAEALAAVFFSPRYVASRFQILSLQPLRQKGITGRVALAITKEYAKMLRGFAVVMGLFVMAGYEIGTNRTSSDFIKFKKGNTRVDLGAGLLQPIVFEERFRSGQTTNIAGKTRDISGREKLLVAATFGRSKLAPIPGMFVDVSLGENFKGDEVDLSSLSGAAKLAADNLIPFAPREIYDTLFEQGMTDAAALSLLALLGAGISNITP